MVTTRNAGKRNKAAAPTSNMPAADPPVLDWSTTPVDDCYEKEYLKVVDDVFTDEECAELIKLAESGDEWKQAAVHYGLAIDQQRIDTNYRNSMRILRFDHDAAEKLYRRILPLIQEITVIKPGDDWEGVVGKPGRVKGTWTMVGMNERLSFLKYGKGNYFRPHCDGQLELPDGRLSRVTIQIYLGEDGVKGGATRILGFKDTHYDVEPKKGRVLIFQQRDIFHSGEDVTKGIKYTLRSDLMYRVEK